MPDTYENQSQPGGDNTTQSANSAGATSGVDRAVDDRPSDTEAAHHNEGGHSWRSQATGPIGGDMGRDESKGPGQGESAGGGDGNRDQGAPEGLPPTSPGGQMEHQDPAHADDLDKVSSGAGDDLGGRKDDTYDPGQVEVNHARQQGGGVGQRDLQRQGDPTRGDTTDQYGR